MLLVVYFILITNFQPFSVFIFHMILELIFDVIFYLAGKRGVIGKLYKLKYIVRFLIGLVIRSPQFSILSE
ncbi:hypothetical protein BG015_002900 [Linnemannia schmuckeri]|uniref:Uncharacterized protein n=1 Tax=Linnemannia schmuckeri TaxID=64567 RepID=A0A9P5S350_9FUNG|nr:hypothetical protein BG015_002900 [Linnemannia schmuckeri]